MTENSLRSESSFRCSSLIHSVSAAANGVYPFEFVCNEKSFTLIQRAQGNYWPPGQESSTVRPPATGRLPYTEAIRNHENQADVYAQRSAGPFLLTLLGQ